MTSGMTQSAPLVWGLLGRRHGDNRQVQALVNALGWRAEFKPLGYNSLFMLPNAILGPSRISLDRESRSTLECTEWPDLVVGVGRRSVPVARWIKARSGGRTRLVQIGRPRAPLDYFDLVITTPQYALPERANVLHNLVPLGSAREAPVTGCWQARFQDLPRPLVGVLVGGRAWPLKLDGKAGEELGRQISSLALQIGAGSVIAAGSPRTEPAVLEGLAKSTRPDLLLYPFKRGGENPYEAMLALCDRFVVTGDSVSMISEATATGKPVHVFDVPLSRGGSLASLVRNLSFGLLKPLLAAGLLSPPRDVERFHRRIYEAGLARPLGQSVETRSHEPQTSIDGEMWRTVARIHQLLT